jgi:hypothetical protein
VSKRIIVIWLACFAAGMAFAESQPGAPSDPVAKLGQSIRDGKVQLTFEQNGFGFLRSLLKSLQVPADSQVLVFSKTSFQQDLISPKAPRALYFNDEVSVGFVQGGEVYELSAIDPARGLQFYTLDAHAGAQPVPVHRGAECLKCHGPVNAFVPGLIVASVYPNRDGTPFFAGGGSLFNMTDERTPFDMRWGGWYVSGTHGSQRHLGNAVAVADDNPFELEQEGTQNLTSLDHKFDTSKYLVPTSDVVALMTLEHQTRATNLITSLNAQTRNVSSWDKLEAKVQRRVEATIEELVVCMVFADEAALAEPVRGVSTFTETFPKLGPPDEKRRSLRDFELQKRLFRYPLSYMVYSAAFDAISGSIKDRIYQRLYDVLTGKDASPKFARLSPESRLAAFEILKTTKRDLPDYWERLEALR